MPSLSGYTFSPAQSQTFSSLAANEAVPVFTASSTASQYTISGYVTSSSAGIAGVTVTLSGGSSASATTSSSGHYYFTLAGGGSYTVTPSLSGYSFSPSSQGQFTAADNSINFTGSTTAGFTSGGSLNPSAPNKEYIYMNGQLVVIEHPH